MCACCGNCSWNYMENEDGEYVPAGNQDGFCIIKDAIHFTHKEDKACEQYDKTDKQTEK